MKSEKPDVAVFWDFENVRLNAKSREIQHLHDFLNSIGNVVLSKVYANWRSKLIPEEVADSLVKKAFDLVQVPIPSKNSIDVKLVTDASEAIRLYPGISTYVIISGDSDYRSLLSTLKRDGKSIILIGRIATMSHGLSEMADAHYDVSELKRVGFNETKSETESIKIHDDNQHLIAIFCQLQLAISKMENEGNMAGIGMVKLILRLINPSFDEKNFGYNSFSQFVLKARDEHFVHLEGELPSTILTLPDDTRYLKDYEKKIELIFETIKSISETKSIPHITVQELLETIEKQQPDFDYLNLGFNNFLALLQSAEYHGKIKVEITEDDGILVFPIFDIESIKEWLRSGDTGFLTLSSELLSDETLLDIAQRFNYYGITLDELRTYSQDTEVEQIYRLVLSTSGIQKLRTHEDIFFIALLGSRRKIQDVIEIVNQLRESADSHLILPESIDTYAMAWLESTIPGITDSKCEARDLQADFNKLDYSLIKRIRKFNLNVWDQEILDALVAGWWNPRLNSAEDVIDTMLELSKPIEIEGDTIYRIKYDYDARLDEEYITKWLVNAAVRDQQKFLELALQSKIDVLWSSSNTFEEAIKDIERDERLTNLLFTFYRNRVHYLIGIFTKQEFSIFIDEVPLDVVVEYPELIEAYIENQRIKDVKEATTLISMMRTQGVLYDCIQPILLWIDNRQEIDLVDFCISMLEEGIEIRHFRNILKKLIPLSSHTVLYQKVKNILIKNTPNLYPSHLIDDNAHLADADYAFSYLTDLDKLEVVRVIFNKIKQSKCEFAIENNVLGLLIQLGGESDLEDIAEYLDKSPKYIYEIIDANREKALEIKSRLKNEYPLTLFEIGLKGIDDFIKDLDFKDAEYFLSLFCNHNNSMLARHYLNQSDELRNLVIDKINEINIAWDSFEAVHWICEMLKKPRRKIIDFVVDFIDNASIENLSLWPGRFLDYDDSKSFNTLSDILSNLKKQVPIALTISAMVHLGVKHKLDYETIWKTPQFHSLDRREQWLLKNNKFYPHHLFNKESLGSIPIRHRL
ncbi:MAG: NYN domain-containing protein [Candidatus Thorarchaeota archaeon]